MLGAATALCVDKTGTLTLNRMTVTQIAVDHEVYGVESKQVALPERLHEVVEYSLLASPTDPFDPMEKAMKELGGRTLVEHRAPAQGLDAASRNTRSPKSCWRCRAYGARRTDRT